MRTYNRCRNSVRRREFSSVIVLRDVEKLKKGYLGAKGTWVPCMYPESSLSSMLSVFVILHSSYDVGAKCKIMYLIRYLKYRYFKCRYVRISFVESFTHCRESYLWMVNLDKVHLVLRQILKGLTCPRIWMQIQV